MVADCRQGASGAVTHFVTKKPWLQCNIRPNGLLVFEGTVAKLNPSMNLPLVVPVV